tara:strand:+ start:50 stop:1039 length:990 start_codon:yes stop_codon:yes gene_type:complete
MSALSKSLLAASDAIKNVVSRLNSDDVELALKLLESCSIKEGKLIISGVGKSGIVARKIAATFSSFGLTAIYLNPLDALHGDLGVICSNDLCMLISNSGETEELISLIPHIKKRNIKVISLTGHKKSYIAKNSEVNLESYVKRETCPLNLAPTSSTSVAMALGDALATSWVERKGVSSHDFAINHPAGKLGKKLTLTVADLMIPADKCTSLTKSSNLKEIINTLTKDGIGCGWVRDFSYEENLIGIITDGDLRRGLEKSPSNLWENIIASDLMTKDPIIIDKSSLALDALEIMEGSTKEITVLPVVENANKNKIFLGFIRIHDLIQAGL